jgi:Glycosyltransferases involved in cell wall biogenesis
MAKPVLYIVVPCYNEEEVLPITSKLFADKLTQLMQNEHIAENSKVMFVNDGSKDGTWPLIQSLAKENTLFCGVNLSRNRGHQNALLAGLMTAMPLCDISISIDADGQDDINAMDCFIKEYENGADVVYGVRSKRELDTAFKRMSAQIFYKLLSTMGVESVYNHADYRLMSSRALKALSEFEEVNLFLRGMVPLIGFKTAVCEYERANRMAGESKYPLSKMLALALNGITSLSVKPLRLISALGLLVSLVSFLGIIWVLITRLFTENAVSGWASTVVAIFFMGGIQLLSLGVIGEYIGKIYSESKHRPRFIIAETTFDDINNNL